MKSASQTLRNLLLPLKHALKGETRYTYVLMGWEGECKRALIGDVYAVSGVDAVAQSAKKNSNYIIRNIRERHEFIGIKLLIAYPCRLARSIFFHRGCCDIEAKAMGSILLLQTRKASVEHIHDKGFIINPSCPSDTTPDSTIPADGTDRALAIEDIVNGDHHAGFFMSPKNLAPEQGWSTPKQTA